MSCNGNINSLKLEIGGPVPLKPNVDFYELLQAFVNNKRAINQSSRMLRIYFSHIARKPIFGVSDQV